MKTTKKTHIERESSAAQKGMTASSEAGFILRRTIEEPLPAERLDEYRALLVRNREYLLGQIEAIQVDVADIEDQLAQIEAMNEQR